MWVIAKMIKQTGGFVTYLDEQNKDIFVRYPTLQPGRVVPLPWHVFQLFYEQGKVDYLQGFAQKKEQPTQDQKDYKGFSL